MSRRRNNVFAAMLGLQLFAEHAYSLELDEEKLKRRVLFCTGIEMRWKHFWRSTIWTRRRAR